MTAFFFISKYNNRIWYSQSFIYIFALLNLDFGEFPKKKKKNKVTNDGFVQTWEAWKW